MLDATSNAIGDAGEAFGQVLLPPVLASARALKFIAETINPERIRSYGIAIGGLAIAYNRAAVATALFVTQINLSKTALIRTGYGALAVVLGEVVHQMTRLKEVTSDFDYFLVGLGLKTIDLTDELGNNTDAITKNANELENLIDLEKEAEEQIQSNIESLQTRLRILEAEEIIRIHGASQTNIVNKMIAESTDGVTQEEFELMNAIAEILVAREKQREQAQKMQR